MQLQFLNIYAYRKKVEVNVSSLSFWNIYYLIGKLESNQKADGKIKSLFQLVNIVPVGKEVVEQAILSDFKDFEDSIQNFCAVESLLKIIITRNTKDYSKSTLAILTPIEFLAEFEPTLVKEPKCPHFGKVE